MLSVKAQSKIVADDSARQKIHMKCRALFFPKNNKLIFQIVACCNCDWHSKGLNVCHISFILLFDNLTV